MIPAGFPFLGYLRHTRPRDHIAAVRELLWTYFLAFLPLWVAFLIAFLTGGAVNLGHVAQSEVDNGAIFLISAAMFSSYLYLLMGDEKDGQVTSFPHRGAFALLFLMLIISWAIVVALQEISAAHIGNLKLDSGAVRTLTIISSLSTVSSLYLIFVYKNATKQGYGVLSREDTDRFGQSWSSR